MLASHDSFHAGMPHLDIFGLSENFCLTHAGNLHWQWISRLTAKRPSQWISKEGHRIYASFVYTSLDYNRDIPVCEDDEISVVCHPCALKAPFFITETTYTKAGFGLVATARMMSTLSGTAHSNTRFTKSMMEFHAKPFGDGTLDATRARFRELRAHDDAQLVETNRHHVNPSVDFNAAKFMYFANFSQLFKRYECPELCTATPLAYREIAYFGNVDAFEWINIATDLDQGAITSAMTRSSDQKCIARSLSKLYEPNAKQTAISALQSNADFEQRVRQRISA